MFRPMKTGKKDVEKVIEEFFREKHKPEEVKKIKKLSMEYRIRLGELKKKFCKKCFFMNLKTLSIKNKVKRVQCENCKSIFRWRVK